MGDDHKDTNPGLVLIGAVILVGGVWLLAGKLGWFPSYITEAWDRLRNADEALALIVLGAAVVLMAQGGRRPEMPAKGTRLYRSRSDKWLGGVLGGLAGYFSIDATVLRLAFIAVGFILDLDAVFLAYLVLWIVVPWEPEGADVPASAPTVPPAPPAPPAE